MGTVPATNCISLQFFFFLARENLPMAIVVDKSIPEFEALATGDIKVSNTSHLGQMVVLFFYF